MKRWLSALFAGALFGVGLALARMTDPNVVLAFLDPFGDFDPSLLFVFGGAVGVAALAFRFVLRRREPVLEDRFRVPLSTAIDRPLLLGAALFGVGWGLAGYCPGPAWVGVAAGVDTALIFAAAMLAGSLLHALTMRRGSTA